MDLQSSKENSMMKKMNGHEKNDINRHHTDAATNGGDDVQTNLLKEKDTVEVEVERDIETVKPLIYRVNEVPPIHMTLVFALQQTLLVISSPLSMTLVVTEVVCMHTDEYLKLQVLSANMLVVGMSTFAMSTFGVRIPVFQGPAKSYIIPLLAMTELPEWKCPATFKMFDSSSNETIVMAAIDNSTFVPASQLSIAKIGVLSGSLMAAGVIHSLIGLTGVVGVICRYIGPVTIVPTIVLIGLNYFKVIVKFSEPHMGVALLVVVCNLLFALVLGNKQTPIPWWSKEKGFHIIWYPLHQVFSILLSILIGWAFCAILTATGVLTDDPNDKSFMTRTDARNFVIEQTDWFMLPKPVGTYGFGPSIFVNFFIATLLSVLDSIGDYAATAKTARVSPPPQYALNRGVAVEGIMSVVSGVLGSCVATVSYGACIGAMGITRVASRRVFQFVGIFFIIFSVIGKIGAVFITIPYPVLGGTNLITTGIFVGVVLSYLSTIDLSATRNVAIIGVALLMGLVMPTWIARNPDAINTGKDSLDSIIRMLLSNPSLIGGVFSCFMDNIVPGTLKERGLLAQMKDLDDDEAKLLAKQYDDGPEVYRLPFIPDRFKRSKFARYIPIIERIPPERNISQEPN